MRLARPDDLASIVRLLDLAFAPSRFESRLVRALIENRRSIHHWVIEHGQEVLAYVCYSPAYHGEEPIGWHLAPLAVDPNWQRQGLGSSLVRATLAQSPIFSNPVFALGDPAYYMRFGFRRVQQPRCRFDPRNEHFMALNYQTGSDSFVVGYEPEFSLDQGTIPSST
jgi:putative acetyltransferase